MEPFPSDAERTLSIFVQKQTEHDRIVQVVLSFCDNLAGGLRHARTLDPLVAHAEILVGVTVQTANRIASILMAMPPTEDLNGRIQEIRDLVEDAGILDSLNGDR